MNESQIILSDLIISNLDINTITKFCPIYQEQKEHTTITKLIYKNNDDALYNPNKKNKPLCKCVFYLHTNKTSSHITIYNSNNIEIFNGNSLWKNKEHNNQQEHIEFIKNLYSVDNVKKYYQL